jgi:hypothetical protein
MPTEGTTPPPPSASITRPSAPEDSNAARPRQPKGSLVVAVIVEASAVPHLGDAINAYNDGLLAHPPGVP